MLNMQRSQKAASQMNNPARVIFVRHGETNWNAEGRIQGQFDEGEVPVLSELGVTQAHEVAEYLAETFTDVSCIYTSDLKRAAQVHLRAVLHSSSSIGHGWPATF